MTACATTLKGQKRREKREERREMHQELDTIKVQLMAKIAHTATDVATELQRTSPFEKQNQTVPTATFVQMFP